jgi:hypothetical protein
MSTGTTYCSRIRASRIVLTTALAAPASRIGAAGSFWWPPSLKDLTLHFHENSVRAVFSPCANCALEIFEVLQRSTEHHLVTRLGGNS